MDTEPFIAITSSWGLAQQLRLEGAGETNWYREEGMHAKVSSGAIMGVDAYIVSVEVDIHLGLSRFDTVGLPEGAVRESKVRVRSALGNVGYRLPQMRITVNLGPADIRKEGAAFDVPMAVGILAAWGRIPRERIKSHLLLGELGLDGAVRPMKGALSLAQTARSEGFRGVIIPRENAQEAALVEGVEVIAVSTLSEVIAHLSGEEIPRTEHSTNEQPLEEDGLDMSQVRGQEHVKRALEVAAAGGHNCLMVGPPGSGKTMLARRLPTILPSMTAEESIETTKVYSVVGQGLGLQGLMTRRPFRAPHHTISDIGLIGGGRFPTPGEISLAHNGVLFLDELPEFKRHALEVLRQPLEEGRVSITRSMTTVSFPGRVMLVAAMNPCPCGMAHSPSGECTCSPYQIHLYRSRISGPLLDRIDIQVDAPAVSVRELSQRPTGDTSEEIRNRVVAARAIQEERFRGGITHSNAAMNQGQIDRYCELTSRCRTLLDRIMERLGLSARAYVRICKLARTIADLAGEEALGPRHIAEAINYRRLDRRVDVRSPGERTVVDLPLERVS